MVDEEVQSVVVMLRIAKMASDKLPSLKSVLSASAKGFSKVSSSTQEKISEFQSRGEEALKDFAPGQEIDFLKVDEGDLAVFKEELEAHGVDFKIRESPNKETFELWYKGRDINQIENAVDRTLERTLKEHGADIKADRAIEKQTDKLLREALAKNREVNGAEQSTSRCVEHIKAPELDDVHLQR